MKIKTQTHSACWDVNTVYVLGGSSRPGAVRHEYFGFKSISGSGYFEFRSISGSGVFRVQSLALRVQGL
jgi:hypothetical protein